MMASVLGFELLPALNEGDERICLADVLMLRDSCLSDTELWAVCMETCLGIQEVNSSEMFQTLCITPESLAFDASGAACFLDLATDPETMYIPPEYETVGNSYKAHLYSLGMTMLFAAEYNAGESLDEQVGMGEKLSGLVTRMTADEYDERASLPEVMRLCEQNLKGRCSQKLCKQMAAVAKLGDSSTGSDESSSYDEDSPVPKGNDLLSIVPDGQSTAGVIDLQNDLPKAAAAASQPDAPPPLLPAAAAASSGSGGAITPPAAFRNSAEDYKRAIVESPVGAHPFPLVSPPKVSRMMAQLDNGEITTVEMAAGGSGSGNESAADDGSSRLLSPTPPTPVTPLSQKTSPVPSFELGASQNSAFQVVWSPRSSKTTSPVPPPGGAAGSGIKDPGGGPGVSLHALADTRLVSYANLLSVALDNSGVDEASLRGNAPSSNPTTISSVSASSATTTLSNNNNVSSVKNLMASGSNNKAESGKGVGVEGNNHTVNNRTDSELRSARNKLDELMAKYGQKLSPRIEVTSTSATTASSSDHGRSTQQPASNPLPHHDLPALVRRSHLQEEQQQHSGEGEGSTQPSRPPSSPSPSPQPPPARLLQVRRDELDFEFGDSISPVPTFVRRGHSSSQSDASSDAETDSLEETEGEEHTEEKSRGDEDSEKVKRGGLGGKLRVSVVKLRGAPNEEGSEDNVRVKPQLSHITAGQLRRLSQTSEARQLAEVVEEEEEEQEGGEGDGERDSSASCSSSEGPSHSRADLDITDDSDATDCSDFHEEDSDEEDEPSRLGSDSDPEEPGAEETIGVGGDHGLSPVGGVLAEASGTAGSGSSSLHGPPGVMIAAGSGSPQAQPRSRADSRSDDDDKDVGDDHGSSQARPGSPPLSEEEEAHFAAGGGSTHQTCRVGGSGASPAASPQPCTADLTTTTTTGRHTASVNRTRAEPHTAGNNTPPQTTSPLLQQGPETLPITNSSNTAQQEEPEETLDDGTLHQEEVEEEDDSLGNGDFSRASLGGMRRGRRGRVTTAGGAGRGRVTSESTAGEDSSEDDHSVNTDSLNTTQEEPGQQQEGPQDTSRVETTPSGSASEGDSSSSEEEEEEVEGEESVSESDTDTPIPATTDTSRGAEEEEEDDEEEEEGVGEEDEKEGALTHKDDGQHTTSDTIKNPPNPGLVAAVAVTSTDSKEQQGQAPLGAGEQEGDKAQEEGTAGQEKDTGTGGEAVEDVKQGSSESSVVPESTTQEEGTPPATSSMMSSRGLPPRAPTGSAGPSNKGSYGEPDRQTQTVQEMLEKLGCGLQETELWALCRECVHALSRYRYDLPAYLSLETVFIEEGGEVGYQSVPDDRELEVVYLAPELQQHGVVTEKTCLFGIAAMLWSAADYKLPQNQEPALSEQLENLLISMTQDNQDLRPAVTDVLQVCSEYDRKHEVSSRLICQGLYSDAQKAEAFGKDNALVRDILGDVVKSQQASRQAQIVDCIKITAQLQSQLKPVSERQLAEKPVVRSLHDKLMDEILNPPKKLRKSSRPKIVDVRDIFLNNPDLMADLRRVVGNQRHVVENSAFMATAHNHQQRPLQPGAPHTVPNAFQSTATHFSPIVVSANGQQAVGKPQLRAGEVYGAEKERKVAKKMRELKKNLLKTRPTQLNIAQDVEKDAMLQEQVISGNLPNHHHHPHLPHHNNLHPHHLQQQHPHLLQGGAGQQGQPMMNGQISPGHLPSGQLPGQIPGQAAGGQGGAAGAGLFPFQVQLQHDPRTGLFQLIPISVQQAQQQQQQAVVQQPVVHPPVYGGGPAHPPPNAHSTPNAPAHTSGVSEAQEMANQIHRESEQRRRYLKHTEEELKARVKAENVDHQRSRSSTSSSSRTSQGHKVKSRSRDKDGHHRGRSHTVATSDLKDDLARATNNVRSRAKEHKHSYSSGTNLKKSNSEENILDKVDKPSRSRSHRSEDARTRLKRAKSGSSLDYRHMEVKMKDVHLEESNSHNINYQHRQRTSNRDSSNSSNHPHHPLSKSQPHLDLDLPQDDVRRPRDAGRTRARTNQGQEDAHLRSPLGDVAVSPPPSPSLSKDSGVSGLNMKSSGELTLMERLLNSDTIRHQQRLSKVICLLRDEFAFDGYMENGVEDFAMAEYILSLGNLKWETFNNAITEKYCDLFWQDELLTGLFEAVNGTRPVIEKRVPSNPKLTTPRSEEHHSSPHHPSPHHPQQASPHRPTTTQRLGRAGSPKPTTKSQKKTAPSSQSQPPQANHASWNGKDIRATQDTITGSAFRPIRAVHPPESSSAGGAAGANHHHPEGGPVFVKPKPLKAPGSHTDTSDSTDNEVSHRPRRYRKKQLEKAKSSSMHDLLLEKQEMELEDNNNQVITKSHSQGDLIDTNTQPVDQPAQNHLGPASSSRAQQQAHKMGIAVSMDGIKPKVVYIRSSESENDSYESNTNAAYHHHQHPYHQPQEELLTQRGRHMRALANSSAAPHHRTSNSFAYRYDSDSSSTSDRRHNEQQYNSHTLPFQRQNPPRGPQRTHSRDDTHSESSRGSSGQSVVGRRLVAAKSEGYLNVLASGDEFGSRERVYSGSKRMFRGSVVYYPAEMEHYLRPEIREFAVQVWNRRKNLAQDTRTKENIEAKMATLDQEMMVEHRQKRKTLRFYQKLVEANRTGKGGDQKSMMSKVAKQLIEMNTKLEFLDSAKKHLEMLYAEQWGLDHYLLYSLSECPPDEPMLLSACENPHLQYQVLKASTGGEGHVLQAGLPEGLMAYLFAQNALSEGYIHQFFYCFRYFVTPAEFLDFLMIKFVAASLSLSPEAAVPVKVKARSVDLLQVWIEGYYSIDFKHNPDLTNLLYDFIKDKVTPVEASAEYLLEVLEDAQDDRHLDLYYPQFCVADDYELQLIQAEAPPKKDDKKQLKEWESFKAALHLSAKPQKLRQPVKTRVSSMSTDRYLSQLEIDKCDHDAYFPRSATLGRLGDEFLLSDYTSQTLAEQLSLMEQDLFRQSHPVHYLNSKAQGVGVALTTPAINKAQSMYRLTAAWEDNQESSLFVGTFTTDDIIQRMIEHSQAVSFWVAAEIVCCDTSKAQVAAISKFLTTARLCQEMRNFATCISILDGLENVLVRQVPAWRNLQTKYAVIMDELASIRVFLKSDAMCLLETDAGRSLPTIPCVLLFLLHVQQLEIGGFRLANTMYKWPKMKAIAKVIDQIRIFKDHSYTYVPDYDLQDLIRQRMRDLGQQDLHVLAAQHDNNFQKVASRMPAIFKRMKGKMGKSSEG